MKRTPGFIKTVALMACFLYLAGMTVPAFIPKAYALFWEDDYDGNDPKERVKRPGGFFLFNWISKIARKSEEHQYSKIESRDTGPTVNNRRRSTLMVTCGLVGLGTGLLISHFATKDDENRTSNMFIGGALGLGIGVLTAALIMPRDYQVEPEASTDFLKHRQAWLQDESSRTIRRAFHPVFPLVRAQF